MKLIGKAESLRAAAETEREALEDPFRCGGRVQVSILTTKNRREPNNERGKRKEGEEEGGSKGKEKGRRTGRKEWGGENQTYDLTDGFHSSVCLFVRWFIRPVGHSFVRSKQNIAARERRNKSFDSFIRKAIVVRFLLTPSLPLPPRTNKDFSLRFT